MKLEQNLKAEEALWMRRVHGSWVSLGVVKARKEWPDNTNTWVDHGAMTQAGSREDRVGIVDQRMSWKWGKEASRLGEAPEGCAVLGV